MLGPVTETAEALDTLTRETIAGLELYDRLCDKLNRGRTRLVREIYRRDLDSRRLYRGKIRVEVYERDCGECQYCGTDLDADEPYHIDHVIPHALGGQTIAENAVLACEACNTSKGARVW